MESCVGVTFKDTEPQVGDARRYPTKGYTMILGVSARVLLEGKLEGIGWFAHEILRRMVAAHPEHQFVFFFDRPYDKRFVYGPNVRAVIVPPPARHPILWFLWAEFTLPRALKKYGCDAFLALDTYMPTSSPKPTITIIHDLGFIHVPHQVPALVRAYYNRFYKIFARVATQVGTVSEYCRQDIATRYDIPAERISVVYNGVRDVFRPVSVHVASDTCHEFAGGHPYFVFVGALQPRKNVEGLLRAFDAFRKRIDSETRLVIVGRRAWLDKAIHDTYEAMTFKNEVVFTGYVNDPTLARIVASARAMTFVPLFEGFGVPAVEAMQCGVPVIASNTSSLPEITQGAALLVDPTDTDAIAEAMARVDTDEGLREQLSRAGTERAKVFSWDTSAHKVWEMVLLSLRPR